MLRLEIVLPHLLFFDLFGYAFKQVRVVKKNLTGSRWIQMETAGMRRIGDLRILGALRIELLFGPEDEN
jgi:hypothetical protein